MNEPNELLALARQVASLRHELGFDAADKELYKIFVRMIDELTDVIFRQEGTRDEELF